MELTRDAHSRRPGALRAPGAAAVVAGLLLVSAGGRARAGDPEGRLSPLAALAKELGAGGTSLAGGAEPAKAFAGLEVKDVAPADLEVLRGSLKGATLRPFSLDLSATLTKGAAAVYELELSVLLDESEPSLLSVSGKAASGAPAAGSLAVGDAKGGARPVADAVRSLVKAFDAGEKTSLPFAEADKLKALLPGEAGAKCLGALERSRKAVANLGTVVSAKGSDGARFLLARVTFLVQRAGAAEGLLPATLEVRGEKLGLALGKVEALGGGGGAAPAADGKWESWYPKDVTAPKGTEYPCGLTALPKGLPGIPESDHRYVDHAYSMILKAVHAKLLALKGLQGKSPDAALRAYQSEAGAALEKLKAEPVPEGLKPFHDDVVGALELQASFFKDATALVKKKGEKFESIWKIPSGRTASQKLGAAWTKMTARYPALGGATKDSLYHHLCALDFF